MVTIKWFKRSGQPVSESAVLRAKNAYITAKLTGRMGENMTCSIQPAVAESIKRMSLTQFVNWSGQFTYRIERK